MALTTYGANALLDASASFPDPVYVQLHTGAPGDAGTSNASATTDRQSSGLDAASSGVTQNTTQLTWSSTLADETLSHVSVWDASSGGNCWLTAALGSPLAVSGGIGVYITAGGLTIDATQ